jgi:hypothetical protein
MPPLRRLSICALRSKEWDGRKRYPTLALHPSAGLAILELEDGLRVSPSLVFRSHLSHFLRWRCASGTQVR